MLAILLLLLSLFHAEVVVGEDWATVTGSPRASQRIPFVGRVLEPDRELEDVVVATEPEPGLPVHMRTARRRGHSKMFITDPFVDELISAAEYQKVLKLVTRADKAAILMLYSPWCPHCLSYKNTFSRLAADLHDKFHFAALNCMENESLLQTCTDLGIFSLPSIKLFVSASIHAKIPDADLLAAPVHTSAGHHLLELLKMHGGGALDSFSASGPNPVAIHSLALPSDDIYAAVQYAAKHTMQNISKSDLRLTLELNKRAFEDLEGKPCQLLRWGSEELPSGTGSQRDVEAAEKAAETLASARAHDAIRGLQYVLASWVVAASDRLTRADEFALIDLLEAVRATIPLKAVKRSAALAILHLYNSKSKEQSMQEYPQSVTAQDDNFLKVVQLYDEFDEMLQETKGMRASDWRKWVGGIPFGEAAPPLASLEEPKLKHCTNLTCSVWMLLHLMAEGAADLAETVIAKSHQCGPEEVFFKRKAQALPIYLLREQETKARGFDYDEVLRIASMDTAELIYHNPSLGCMIVPSFELVYYISNVLRRFFGCTACRHHFRIQFERQTHGLANLQPPRGVYTLSIPIYGLQTPISDEDELSLLEEFRCQENHSTDAWSKRRVERNKLNTLKLWLWRLHNAVTVRTAADTTLAFAKGDQNANNYTNCDTRWPPKSACAECRSQPTPATGLISPAVLEARDANPDILAIEEEVSDFDQLAVLDHLRKSYWPKAFQKK